MLQKKADELLRRHPELRDLAGRMKIQVKRKDSTMECEETYLKAEESVFTPLSGTESSGERVDRLRRVLLSLEGLVSESPSEGRYWALLGVARYFLLGETVEVDGESVRSTLEKALALAPECFHARLYLAYQCFDEGDYGCASSLIDTVLNEDCDRLATWTQLKLRELSIVCRIRMDAEAVSARDLIAFHELWSTTAEDDRVFPDELCRTMKLDAILGRE
ncbi:tetratricopeptide repeat protein [Marilutibacter maris]|uniref:hypothetical protein n=1 Tax=Marilutibacter maris TaxID=1605891 RepID=UPI0011AEB95A|nr:hypothetical protein [Lysobacter maris]